MTDFMKDQKQIKIGDTVEFNNLGELNLFCESPQFKKQNYKYIGGIKHTIKRIK
nr:hypothetical protein BACY1_20710 [Tenacibaculum mesophilum]